MAVKDNVPYQKLQKVASPVAGAEWSIAAPGQGLWRVVSAAFRLVTDATVANRTVTLVADDGTDVWFRSVATAQQAASLTVDYGAFAGGSPGGFAGVAGVMPFTQDGLWLQPGWRLRSVTGAIAATDQYSGISLLVEEFPNGPGFEWQPTVDRGLYERS